MLNKFDQGQPDIVRTDFDQIAHAIKWSIPDDKSDIEAIVEQLRQVWNARGAADVAMFEAELSLMVATKTTHERLAAALRSLDR